ncbi:MAG: molecular chaperone HtpG [Paludibacteraceae bacterium]|nr:molecular chaperone HtpG [Paludibacteraceae bacterium]
MATIKVTSENIFPVIKKFLYSDHEIFLRELISNAVDATQKLKTLSRSGDVKGDLGDMRVRVLLDKKKKTLTVQDHGIGMTAEEVDKYINQIAFSGAEEFVNKYKDQAEAIIGHFGLGFYSAFMVADKVEIFSLSYKDDSKAVHWSCSGDTEVEMEDTIKSERGTDIVLHINKEFEQYLEDATIEGLLKKYCKFLPVEIAFGKKKEWKDGKEVELDEENIINNTAPAWTKKPADLKEEDYKTFYHELYPTLMDEPLFHIHLNVDYPFNLTGILYFPKIKSNLDVHRNKIQLYCNQVFVTDEVENIVPEYLTLLHGVIDSPDIPLNVSRSYLQSDNNVKKISGHITKKVADKLAEMYKTDKADFEKKWDDIKMFIQFGMLTDEKFYEKAVDFALLKNLNGEYYTQKDYIEKIKANQTGKDGNIVVLYTQDKDQNYTYIERAKQKGYDILEMTGELDVHQMSQAEQKQEKLRFVRVDSDVIENIIKKNDNENANDNYTTEQKEGMRKAFEGVLPENSKLNYFVNCEATAEDALPVFLTQNEFMRRMKEMSAHQQGMSFYGQMPDQYNLVINTAHPLIKELMDKMTSETVMEEVKKDASEHSDKENVNEKQEMVEKTVWTLKDQDERLKQLLDIALLASGQLKGEALANFVNRSVSLL